MKIVKPSFLFCNHDYLSAWLLSHTKRNTAVLMKSFKNIIYGQLGTLIQIYY